MKNNKILVIESIISFFIIIIIVSIITVICLKINSESQKVNCISESSLIVTNILENMNSRRYSLLEEYIDNLSVFGVSKTIEENDQIIIVNGNDFNDKFFGTEIPKGYIVTLKIHNINEKFDIQKRVTLTILYKGEEYIDISTIIEREIVDVCNKPDFSENNFEEAGIDLNEYEIIPIKYSYKTNSYVVTTAGDKDWYNYYSKEWAKVLVFPKYGEDLKNQFIDSQGNVKKQINYDRYILDFKNYMYVWIPNFSIKDSISYFRYGSGENAIKQELMYKDGEYLYINSVSDVIPDISRECNFNGLTGVWRNINSKDEYYLTSFSSTRFGPINLH